MPPWLYQLSMRERAQLYGYPLRVVNKPAGIYDRLGSHQAFWRRTAMYSGIEREEPRMAGA